MVHTSRVQVVETVTSAFGLVFANLGAYARHVGPFLAAPAVLSVALTATSLRLPDDLSEVPADAIVPVAIASAALVLLNLLAYVLAALVAVSLTRDLRAGRAAPRLGETWSAIRDRVGPGLGAAAIVTGAILLAVVLVALIAVAGAAALAPDAGAADATAPRASLVLVLLLAAGVAALAVLYAAFRWFVVYPVLVVERLGAAESLRRSWDLTRGHVITLFLCGLLVALAYVPVAIALGIVTLPLAAVGQEVAAAILADAVSFLASLVIQPVGAALAFLVHETLTRPAAVPGPVGAGAPPVDVG